MDDVVEVTERFHDHPLEEAPQLVFGGRLLEVDPICDYGRSFGRFVDEYLGPTNHRSTLLILDGGRGRREGRRSGGFEHLARRARSVIWLTPEMLALGHR